MIRQPIIQTARFAERLKALFQLRGSDHFELGPHVVPTLLIEDPQAPENQLPGATRLFHVRSSLGAGGAGVKNFHQLWNPTPDMATVLLGFIFNGPANSAFSWGMGDVAYTLVERVVVRDTRIAPPSVVWDPRASMRSEVRTRQNAADLNYYQCAGPHYVIGQTNVVVPYAVVIGPGKGFIVKEDLGNLSSAVTFWGYERELDQGEPR